MKKNLFFVIGAVLLSVVVLFSISTNVKSDTAAFKYVGVSKCVTCHKTDAQGKQQSIWENSKHSKAWKTLETPEADKIAADKGFSTPAKETPQCIKCHVLGKDINPAELEDSFDKTQGVQCESCHGPGSEYKAMSIMKDKQKSIENGLTVHANNESDCTGCHNAESPTFKGFNYEEAWAQIKHTKP